VFGNDLFIQLEGVVQCPYANSVYFDSITQEILISEVLIIMMLIPSFASAPNMVEATPEWLLIPIPTMDTLAIFSSVLIS